MFSIPWERKVSEGATSVQYANSMLFRELLWDVAFSNQQTEWIQDVLYCVNSGTGFTFPRRRFRRKIVLFFTLTAVHNIIFVSDTSGWVGRRCCEDTVDDECRRECIKVNFSVFVHVKQ